MNAPRPPSRFTRRQFIAANVAAGFLAATRSPARIMNLSPETCDLLIRGGRVYDGTGAEGRLLDIAIAGSSIAAVGESLQIKAREVIDATGLAIAPGFIDIHAHGDGSIFQDPSLESVIRQGVTTIVVGQDGFAPSSEAGEEAAFDSYERFFRSVAALPPAANLASMVGLGAVRRVEVGMTDRPAKPEELARMVARVEAALAAGCCGVSTGLEYIPGAFARTDELIALSRPLARHRLPYASHLRNEDDRLLEAIDEAIAIGRGAGCPIHLSHLKTMGARNWPKIGDALDRVDRANRAGQDVSFDRYPYTAAATGLQNLFPSASRAGGAEHFLQRLADLATAAELKIAALAKVELIGGWDKIVITSVKAAEDRALPGTRLDLHAQKLGLSPYDATVALLRRNRAEVGMVEFMMSEENLARFLKHPRGMVCSDGGAFAVSGPARRDHPHPRSLGSFPRVLGKYVREEKVLSLPEAIHKMTGLPAARLQLTDRGHIRTGIAADLVIFDPQSVIDRATYENPFQYADGIKAVFVNGHAALHDGVRSPQRSGKVLKPNFVYEVMA